MEFMLNIKLSRAAYGPQLFCPSRWLSSSSPPPPPPPPPPPLLKSSRVIFFSCRLAVVLYSRHDISCCRTLFPVDDNKYKIKSYIFSSLFLFLSLSLVQTDIEPQQRFDGQLTRLEKVNGARFNSVTELVARNWRNGGGSGGGELRVELKCAFIFTTGRLGVHRHLQPQFDDRSSCWIWAGIIRTWLPYWSWRTGVSLHLAKKFNYLEKHTVRLNSWNQTGRFKLSIALKTFNKRIEEQRFPTRREEQEK